MNIIKLLSQIDCTDHEAKTFVALIEESNGATVLYLSKKLNLPRSTIYGHLDELIKKGLVKKTLNEFGSVFFAEDLDNVLKIYNEKIEELKNAKNNLSKIIKTQKYKTSHQPKFIYYNTKDAAKSIFRDMLRSGVNQTYWFWPLKEMVKIITPEVLRSQNFERVKRGMWANILWPPKRKVDIKDHPLLGPWDTKESKRRIKILPENIDQTLGYIIYGSKVAFISSDRENFGMIIDSQELSQTLKVQFDYFWKISKQLKIP